MAGSQPEFVDAPFYAQVAPTFSQWSKDAAGNPLLEAAKVTALTQGRPDRPKPGTVLVKLTLRMPGSAFLPLAPEAVIVIPPDLIAASPLEVVARDPGRRLAAAQLVERVAVGGEGEVRDREVQRILDEPEHAREVVLEALRYQAEFGTDAGDSARIGAAAGILGVDL